MSTFPCKCYSCGKPLVRKRQTRDVKLHFCDNVCKAEYQRTFKPVTKEWLVEHYIDKRMDTTQIAHIVNRDPKSVWNWLKDFGIPTRPRGGFTSPNCFKKGDPNPFKGKHHTEEVKQRLREIAIADGRVPFDPKIGSYMKGKRGSDTPSWKGGCTPERQAVYSSPEWKQAVIKVWKRDNATCQNCQKHKGQNRNLPFDIHHIKSFSIKECRINPENLVLLCEPCHYWVHSKRNSRKEFINDGS